MEFHLGYHPPRHLPTRRLVQEAFVPDHRLVARSSHWPSQQLRDVSLQAVIGGDSNGILHATLLQRLVDLRLGESGSARNTTSLPAFCCRSISGSSISSQPSALCTLPGRSVAAKQSPPRLNNNSG